MRARQKHLTRCQEPSEGFGLVGSDVLGFETFNHSGHLSKCFQVSVRLRWSLLRKLCLLYYRDGCFHGIADRRCMPDTLHEVIWSLIVEPR